MTVTWRKSSRCANDENCVEVAKVTGGRLVRDSKDKNSRPLSFTNDEWATFILNVKAGNLD